MVTAEDSQWNLLPSTLTNAWTLFNCSTQRQWWRLWRNRRVWICMMRRQRVIKFNTHCSEQLSENCSTLLEWDQIWCSRQNVCHTNLCHLHLQIWHVPRKCWDIWKEHENRISIWRYLHWNRMTWTRPWNTSRDIQTMTGLVIQWQGRAHLAHCVTLINFSWRVNVENKGLLPCPVENQKCMLLVHCQLNWFSNKLYWKRLDYHSWYTREQTAAQHAQWQRNKEQVARSRFGISETSNDVISQDWCESEWHWNESTWDARDSTDWDRCFAWVLSWARRVHLANGTVATNDSGNLWIRVWWIGRVERSTHVSMSRFLKFSSVQRGTPRESDTASRREEACLLNPCNVVAQWSHHSLAQ